ncbi:MAG: hypothetical protein DMG58_17105 [Acidobacteria bacterium]|nr:MAG: hypothetical protein DMG58_17105 [Acidobacteriota bacterium]
MQLDETELVKRAITAYCRGRSVVRQGFQKPGEDSAIEKHDGKSYVVLRNAGRVLAVYRVLSGGRIRRIEFDELPVGLGGIP